ncbi:RsmB/NOP family class I SAM-dependent RNA methyltransferase [Paenibacillus sp. y28]|uniref:RsmB/NOP family class I SAM-dependent RNA methyltransferase n=1 Tax=Paenibacillus sp. y28 TaxID=3129110 RepID=UPI0030174F02
MGSVLPEQFLKRMEELLGEEFPAFLASYDAPRAYGLRVNGLKADIAAFRSGETVPWCETGCYTSEAERPGKHPFYHAGLYYIQEPSAMLPAALLRPEPGDRVLDLCAAPGGKSTQLAALLQGKGMLVTNDLHPDRTKVLAKNIELAGVTNAVVLNESPERLAERFPGFFDKILVDAPCSGEGMFRREPDMVKDWLRHGPAHYARLQRDILRQAAGMLAPGGRLVYSTCTFSPEENEEIILEFLLEHPEFRVVPAPRHGGLAGGRPDWADRREKTRPEAGRTHQAAVDNDQKMDSARVCEGAPDSIAAVTGSVGGTLRVWPHLTRGEGHFAALLERSPAAESGEADQAMPEASSDAGKDRQAPAASAKQRTGRSPRGTSRSWSSPDRSQMELLEAFLRQHVSAVLQDKLLGSPLVQFGDYVYACPEGLPSLDGLKVVRPGLFLGTVKKHRFEPSHALALTLQPDDVYLRVRLPADDPLVIKYLKGETLDADKLQMELEQGAPAKGYCLVCVERFSLGWGKWQNGLFKNEYPAGWRWS